MLYKSSSYAASMLGAGAYSQDPPVNCSRRRFVLGLATAGAVGASGFSAMSHAVYTPAQPQVLSGKHFTLAFDYKKVNFTGVDRLATAINGSVPAPILRWKQGERITLDVQNNLAVDSSIHWQRGRVWGRRAIPGLHPSSRRD